MTSVKLVSTICFLVFNKRVFNRFGNIPLKNKNTEVASVGNVCLIQSFLKYFVTKKFGK